MSKKRFFLAITLLIAIFITACDSSDNQDTDTSKENPVSNEEDNNANDESKNKSEDKKTSDENTKEDDQITEDEAIEKVKVYVKEHEDYDPEHYEFGVEEKEKEYNISIFPNIPDDDQRGAQIVGHFKVDKATGKVEELDDITGKMKDKKEKVSEIVDMNKDEQRTHHERLAVKPDNIKNEVYEHLLLPGVHENTKKYEGRINPGEKIRFEFPDAGNIADRSTFDPKVAEDGYFTIKMNPYNFKEGQNIRVYIINGYPHEQTFDLPVHEAEEKMEEIRVKK